jgi:hypothetical protein
MHPAVRRSTTHVVAIALSALTIAVFGLQQYLGPNSSVQRMHEAVRRQSVEDFGMLLVEPVEDPFAVELYQTLRVLLAQGRRLQIQQTQTRGRVAHVAVLYTAEGTPNVSIVYVLGLDRGGWRVSARETARVFQMLRGGPRI